MPVQPSEATPPPPEDVVDEPSCEGGPPRLLRSPSRDSANTELSLLAVSSAASMSMSRAGLRVVLPSHIARGPSPTPTAGDVVRHRLQRVPGGGRDNNSTTGSTAGGGAAGTGEGGLWGEEDTELIRSCGALSSALGLQKSFSTSDIVGAAVHNNGDQAALRSWASEINVFTINGRLEGVFPPRLDPTSRSCSTWVAVGDVASTSQLPSPQARHAAGPDAPPTITAADFIRSVNKKVRQNYIKRRLVSTYRALQRFSQSSLQLQNDGTTGVKLEAGGITLVVPGHSYQTAQDIFKVIRKEVELTTPFPSALLQPQASSASPVPAASSPNPPKVVSISSTLTAQDIERDRGRQLTKYERNMMIFNWLQTLEETTYDMMS